MSPDDAAQTRRRRVMMGKICYLIVSAGLCSGHAVGRAPVPFVVGRVGPAVPDHRGRGNASDQTDPLSRARCSAVLGRRRDGPRAGRREPSGAARERHIEHAGHPVALDLERGFLSESHFSVVYAGWCRSHVAERHRQQGSDLSSIPVLAPLGSVSSYGPGFRGRGCFVEVGLQRC